MCSLIVERKDWAEHSERMGAGFQIDEVAAKLNEEILRYTCVHVNCSHIACYVYRRARNLFDRLFPGSGSETGKSSGKGDNKGGKKRDQQGTKRKFENDAPVANKYRVCVL